MYCSACGTANAQNLKYCTQCGAMLRGGGGRDADASPLITGLLIAAMVAVFIFGMAAVFAMLETMRRDGMGEGVIVTTLVASFLLMLSLEGTFLWVLLRQGVGRGRRRDAEVTSQHATNKLPPAPAQPLIDQAPSIAEGTTRNLDPVRVERPDRNS
jgi:hypothetical protein